MLRDDKTNTLQGVFNINCPKCKVVSFVGFECTQEQLEDPTFGLMGFARRQDGLIEANVMNEWIHCPACDETINDNEVIKTVVTDVTKPKP